MSINKFLQIFLQIAGLPFFWISIYNKKVDAEITFSCNNEFSEINEMIEIKSIFQFKISGN